MKRKKSKMVLELSASNVLIEKDEKYYRVIIKYTTHKFHSEKLNLETSIHIRDAILGIDKNR